jgi:hypothetical protein
VYSLMFFRAAFVQYLSGSCSVSYLFLFLTSYVCNFYIIKPSICRLYSTISNYLQLQLPVDFTLKSVPFILKSVVFTLNSVVFTLKQTLLSIEMTLVAALFLCRKKCRNDTPVFTVHILTNQTDYNSIPFLGPSRYLNLRNCLTSCNKRLSKDFRKIW